MEIRGSERTQQTRPAAPPIDLNAGRLDIVRAALAGGFVLVALLVVVLGACMVIYFRSPAVVVLGIGVAGIGLAFGGTVLYVSVTEWTDHRRRVQEWHEAALSTYVDMNGAERVEQVSEWEMTATNPAHVLVAAMWVHMRLQDGESGPFTVRKLNTALFLCNRRVGNLSKIGAEHMGQQFARLGLIEGRREGHSGVWVPETADDVLRLVVDNWR